MVAARSDDFEKIQKDIDRITLGVKRGTVRDYAQMLRDVRAEIADAMAKYSKGGTLSYAEMQRYNRIKSLNTSIEDIIQGRSDSVQSGIWDGFKKSAYAGFEGAALPLADMAGISAPEATGKQIQTILNKPYEGITIDERMILRTRDLGVRVRATITNMLTQEGTLQDFNAGVKDVIERDLVKTVRFTEDTAHSIGQQGVQTAIDTLAVKGIRVTKTWVTAGDGQVREAHQLLDGQTVDGDEYFVIPSGEYAGMKADGPGLFGVAALDKFCRCIMVAGVQEE